LNFTVAVATPGRIDSLELLKKSFNETTSKPNRIEFIFIDNANTFDLDLSDWLDDLNAEKKRFIKNETSQSVAQFWHRFIVIAEYNWVILVNDDVLFTSKWDKRLEGLISDNPSFGMFLMCLPQQFSGFAINKEFYEKYGPFRQEYPRGGWEDIDFFMTVALKAGCKSRKEIYDQCIYPADGLEGGPLIKHHILRDSKYRRSWNHAMNFRVFEKYWERVDALEGAIWTHDGKICRPKPGLPLNKIPPPWPEESKED